jgi:hypothetical protein
MYLVSNNLSCGGCFEHLHMQFWPAGEDDECSWSVFLSRNAYIEETHIAHLPTDSLRAFIEESLSKLL